MTTVDGGRITGKPERILRLTLMGVTPSSAQVLDFFTGPCSYARAATGANAFCVSSPVDYYPALRSVLSRAPAAGASTLGFLIGVLANSSPSTVK